MAFKIDELDLSLLAVKDSREFDFLWFYFPSRLLFGIRILLLMIDDTDFEFLMDFNFD